MTDDLAKEDSANQSDATENLEWELSDLVDAIAAEIDEAQDTLSLKSYSRGLSFSIKKLSLNIEVRVRRTADRKLLFRTIDSNETSATVLKLDFDQVLQSQLTDVRKSFDEKLSDGSIAISTTSLEDTDPFSNIADKERRALEILGIRSIDDLKRYPNTSQIISEISRKTKIEASKIQNWRNHSKA